MQLREYIDDTEDYINIQVPKNETSKFITSFLEIRILKCHYSLILKPINRRFSIHSLTIIGISLFRYVNVESQIFFMYHLLELLFLIIFKNPAVGACVKFWNRLLINVLSCRWNFRDEHSIHMERQSWIHVQICK